MPTLLNEAAEFALECLDKRDALSPFCKLRTTAGETAYIVVEREDVTCEQVALSVRDELKRRVAVGDVAEFAICTDRIVKYKHLPESVRILEVEYQNGGADSALYHFPLTVTNGVASLAPYLLLELREKLL